MNFFETGRLTIRAIEPEDIDCLYQWENDTDVWKVSANMTPLSRQTLMNFINTQNYDVFDTKQLRLIIEHKQSCRPIGTVDLLDIDIYNRRAQIGILIYAKSDNGNGYAKETIDTMTKYCFETLSLRQLYCNISAENERSLELFKRCGFEISGLKKEWRKTKTGWSDEYILQNINKL